MLGEMEGRGGCRRPSGLREDETVGYQMLLKGGVREENITDTGKYLGKCFQWDLMKTLESSHCSTAM